MENKKVTMTEETLDLLLVRAWRLGATSDRSKLGNELIDDLTGLLRQFREQGLIE